MRKALLLLMLALPLHATEIGRSGAHVFHSSFWMNLHERLRHESMHAEEHAFSGAETAAWRQALVVYRTEVGSKNPIFDRGLALVWHALAATPDDATPKDIPPLLIEALQQAAPVYRARLWKEDDARNRFWTRVAVVMLDEAGAEMARGISRVYGTTFPKRIDMEVAPFVDEYGAATPDAHDGKYLTVVASNDPAYQGFNALEMMFHEPMHHFDQAMLRDIDAAANGAKVPRNLSHALLFYTSGELARRAWAKRGIVYTPIANEVANRAWKDLIAPIEKDWTPVLDGKVSRAKALQSLIKPE
ncbi:MAG TPA: hypothetical protein VM733_08685 [Thermoanaerobaculia bacterium]|nr:hypothetical protein [Thermoanaerobaculia bacterium]